MTIRAIIFDFNRTLYDPDSDRFYSGVFEMIRDLRKRGVKLGLWSRDEKTRREKIGRDGLGDLFDDVLIVERKTSDDVPQILNRLGVSAQETIFVTDPIMEDIRYAKAAGCVTISVKQGKFANEEPASDDEEPMYEVADIPEAYKFLLDLLRSEE